MLQDLRSLCEQSQLPGTFSYSDQYFNYETYVVFKKELTINVTLAVLAVFVVVLSITINFIVSFMIVSCVMLVDLFLFGILAYWNVTLNHITIINIVMALGLAVDYSAHIGHAYLLAQNEVYNRHGDIMTNHQQRVNKARKALGSTGSSVIHGAMSTLLAIIVLAPSQSYIFQSFFKMWLGIIIFGIANGFVLLPVLLALAGPLIKRDTNAPSLEIIIETTPDEAEYCRTITARDMAFPSTQLHYIPDELSINQDEETIGQVGLNLTSMSSNFNTNQSFAPTDLTPDMAKQPQNTEKQPSIIGTPSTVRSYRQGLINFTEPKVQDQSDNYEKIMKSFFGGRINTPTPAAGETTKGEAYNSSPVQINEINESHEVESSCYDATASLNLSVVRLSSADLLTDHGNESPQRANNAIQLNRARNRVVLTPISAKAQVKKKKKQSQNTNVIRSNPLVQNK